MLKKVKYVLKNCKKVFFSEIQITCFVLAFILFMAIFGTLFAISIIYKARKYIIKYLQRSSSIQLSTGYPLSFIRLPPPYTETLPPPRYSNDDYISNMPPPSYFNVDNNMAPPAYSDSDYSENKQPKSFFRRKFRLICYSCDV